MKVLVVDNYDSFTYNLVQYLGELGAELEVVRNDVETSHRITEEIERRLEERLGPVHATIHVEPLSYAHGQEA